MTSQSLVLAGNNETLARRQARGLPDIVLQAGAAAETAWADFFDGTLANHHTRVAYNLAVRRFLAWAQEEGRALHQITAGDVGRYFHVHTGSLPTKKQHIAALRRFFDLLVERHLVLLNPAAVAKTERYQVVEGKTPKITHEQARDLLASLDVRDVVGLRDRAVIGTLIYTAARAGAVAKLELRHFYDGGEPWLFHFEDKGGKSREIPYDTISKASSRITSPPRSSRTSPKIARSSEPPSALGTRNGSQTERVRAGYLPHGQAPTRPGGASELAFATRILLLLRGGPSR